MKRTVEAFTIYLGLISVTCISVGCGCQPVSVSELTITPPAPCLMIDVGRVRSDGSFESGTHSPCDDLFLFGTNNCTDPLEIDLPNPVTRDLEQITVAAGAQIEIEVPGGFGQSYALNAQLGSLTLSLEYDVGN